MPQTGSSPTLSETLIGDPRKWNNEAGSNQIGEGAVIHYSLDPRFLISTPFSSDAKAAALEMMKRISAIVDIKFVQVDESQTQTTDLAFAQTGSNRAYTSLSYRNGQGDDPDTITKANVNLPDYTNFDEQGSYARFTLMHELLHALGLRHPHDHGDDEHGEEDHSHVSDSWQHTIMSYSSETSTGADFTNTISQNGHASHVGGLTNTLMLQDIIALQELYGANENSNHGDTIYGFNGTHEDELWNLDSATDSIIGAVWDTGGIDTLDLSGFSIDALIDLSPGSFSSFGGLTSNFSIAPDVIIENAIGGTGDDLIKGNDANNRLIGGAGDDVIYGLAGDDYIDGGAGLDWLFGGDGDDKIVYDGSEPIENLNGGDGFDTIIIKGTLFDFDFAALGFEQIELHSVFDETGELIITHIPLLPHDFEFEFDVGCKLPSPPNPLGELSTHISIDFDPFG